MRPALRSLPVALAALATLTACGGGASPTATTATAFPMTVASCGLDVTFQASPKRIITVGSVAAPLVAAAGAADKIVVRAFETAQFPGEYGPALAKVEVTGPTTELAREAIINRTPDLVISYDGAATTASDLAAAGIPMLVNKGYCKDAKGDFADIFADIETYGRLLGTADAATAEVARLRDRVAAVQTRFPAPATPRTAAALIFSRDGATLSAYGSTSTVDKQMATLGLTNVYGDVAKRNFEAGVETLIAKNPQVLLLLTQGDQTPDSVRQALTARPELASVAAIRDGHVVVVPFGYTGPGPVAVEGLEKLATELAR